MLIEGWEADVADWNNGSYRPVEGAAKMVLFIIAVALILAMIVLLPACVP
jgi:hypothetical protein